MTKQMGSCFFNGRQRLVDVPGEYFFPKLRKAVRLAFVCRMSNISLYG
jgi:hypothetical protein